MSDKPGSIDALDDDVRAFETAANPSHDEGDEDAGCQRASGGATLGVKDLAAAAGGERSFYETKLGLKAVREEGNEMGDLSHRPYLDQRL